MEDAIAISDWLKSHPKVVLKQYEQRRRLFLDFARKDPARCREAQQSRFEAGGSYQQARLHLARRGQRSREQDAHLVAERGTTDSEAAFMRRKSVASVKPMGGQCELSIPRHIRGTLFAAIHQVFQEQVQFVTALALGRERACIAIASKDGEIVINGLDTDDSTEGQRLDGHKAAIMDIDFCVGDTYLASGSEDATVRMWRVENGACLREFSLDSAVCSVAFHPNNANLLLFGDVRRGLACANVSVGKDAARCLVVRDIVTAVFDHTGAAVFAVSQAGNVEVLQLQERHHETHNWELTLWHSFPIVGRRTRNAPSGGQDMQLGSCRIVYTSWAREFESPALMVPWLDRTVRLFSWDGLGNGRPLSWRERLMDARSNALTCRLVLRLPTAPRSIPGPVAFSGPGSAYVICGKSDGALSVVDLKTLKVSDDLKAHSQRVCAVRSSYSGDLLASGDAHGCVVVWGTSLPTPRAGKPAAADTRMWSEYDDSVAE